MLLGVLANYNRFEYRNPYRSCMSDFTNEAIILRYQEGFGETCSELRNSYAMVHPDTPEPWNFSSALSSLGLGILAPIKAITPAVSENATKEILANLSVISFLKRHMLMRTGQGLTLLHFLGSMISPV